MGFVPALALEPVDPADELVHVRLQQALQRIADHFALLVEGGHDASDVRRSESKTILLVQRQSRDSIFSVAVS